MAESTSQFLQRSPALPFVELRQADRSSACYQQHTHDEFSFGLIDQGHTLYRNRGQSQSIGAGSMVTVNPGEVHSCNPAAGLWSYRMIFLNAAWLGELQRELSGGSADYQCFPEVTNRRSDAGKRFDQLFASLLQADTPLAAQTQLIELMQPLFAAESLAPEAKHGGVLLARDLIMDQLDANLQLDTLAEVAGLNRYQLIRGFKREFGQAPHAYQLDARIKQARVQLRRGACSLNGLALDLGFADQAHFQRHFKLRTALTPGQYRAFYRAA
ncbi:MAG: AraC family transcriptional regulator [Pseudomonas neustonica]|tara:strand:+ start:5108 stop:5920 length:813 start_codon:yes stop_codon:yes gene_type:complete